MNNLDTQFRELDAAAETGWTLLRAANAAAKAGTPSGDLYNQWVAHLEARDSRSEALREQYFPKAGHLFIGNGRATVASPKMRNIRVVWERSEAA